MELDEHCLVVLGKLARGEMSYLEAEWEITTHGDSLMRQILEHGFTVTNYSPYAERTD